MLSIRRIGSIGRTYRHIKRYRQILQVFLKYGFVDVIDALRLDQYIEVGRQLIFKKERLHTERLSRAERIRRAMEELGPTFIKLGQVISTRPDLVPLEYAEEFSRLQDNVQPFPYAAVSEIIRSELGRPPEDIFAHFEETPLAAASIGQVHKASLKSGEDVVVKIQRPGIRAIIEIDLEILLHIASLMERHLEELEFHRPTSIVEEFARTMEYEIDYAAEAANVERFARQFLDNENIYVPKIYGDLVTERVLTMEYIDGVKVSNVDYLVQKGYNLPEIAKRGVILVMEQIFVHGFFHADPHPGNLFVLPSNVICFLDFGMMGRINRPEREVFSGLIMAVVQHDGRKAAEALLKMVIYRSEPEINLLERDLEEFMDRHLYRPLKELEISRLLHQILDIVSKHGLRLKPNQFLLMKALSTVEGVGRMLYPDLNVIKHAEPFIRHLQTDRMHPKRLAGEMLELGSEFAVLLKETPRELRAILKQARAGEVKIEFEHHGLEPMLASNDRISNRVAFAIVLAALMISSALIVHSRMPPTWHGIPVIGLAGFLAAACMGLWLLISIIRHGRM